MGVSCNVMVCVNIILNEYCTCIVIVTGRRWPLTYYLFRYLIIFEHASRVLCSGVHQNPTLHPLVHIYLYQAITGTNIDWCFVKEPLTTTSTNIIHNIGVQTWHLLQGSFFLARCYLFVSLAIYLADTANAGAHLSPHFHFLLLFTCGISQHWPSLLYFH